MLAPMAQSCVAGGHLGVQTKRQESARPYRKGGALGTAGTLAVFTQRKASGKNNCFVVALSLTVTGLS